MRCDNLPASSVFSAGLLSLLFLGSISVATALPKDFPDLVLARRGPSAPRLTLTKKNRDKFDLKLGIKSRSKPKVVIRKPVDPFDGKVDGKNSYKLKLGKKTHDRSDLAISKRSRSKAKLAKRSRDPSDMITAPGRYLSKTALFTKNQSRMKSRPRLSTGRKTLDQPNLDLAVTPKNYYHLR